MTYRASISTNKPLHKPTTSITYGGMHLGTARLNAGGQPATSYHLLHFPTRLDGVQLVHRTGLYPL
jgi:hypothetical protein